MTGRMNLDKEKVNGVRRAPNLPVPHQHRPTEASATIHLLQIPNDYKIRTCKNAAEIIYREIVKTPRKRRSAQFVNEVRKQLLFLHDYYSHTAQKKRRFPFSKSFVNLLVEYVHLEQNVLHSCKNLDAAYKEEVANRVVTLLEHMLVGCAKPCPPGCKFPNSLLVLHILMRVPQDDHAELENIFVDKILKKMGLDQAFKDLKNGTLYDSDIGIKMGMSIAEMFSYYSIDELNDEWDTDDEHNACGFSRFQPVHVDRRIGQCRKEPRQPPRVQDKSVCTIYSETVRKKELTRTAVTDVNSIPDLNGPVNSDVQIVNKPSVKVAVKQSTNRNPSDCKTLLSKDNKFHDSPKCLVNERDIQVQFDVLGYPPCTSRESDKTCTNNDIPKVIHKEPPKSATPPIITEVITLFDDDECELLNDANDTIENALENPNNIDILNDGNENCVTYTDKDKNEDDILDRFVDIIYLPSETDISTGKPSITTDNQVNEISSSEVYDDNCQSPIQMPILLNLQNLSPRSDTSMSLEVTSTTPYANYPVVDSINMWSSSSSPSTTQLSDNHLEPGDTNDITSDQVQTSNFPLRADCKDVFQKMVQMTSDNDINEQSSASSAAEDEVHIANAEILPEHAEESGDKLEAFIEKETTEPTKPTSPGINTSVQLPLKLVDSATTEKQREDTSSDRIDQKPVIIIGDFFEQAEEFLEVVSKEVHIQNDKLESLEDVSTDTPVGKIHNNKQNIKSISQIGNKLVNKEIQYEDSVTDETGKLNEISAPDTVVTEIIVTKKDLTISTEQPKDVVTDETDKVKKIQQSTPDTVAASVTKNDLSITTEQSKDVVTDETDKLKKIQQSTSDTVVAETKITKVDFSITTEQPKEFVVLTEETNFATPIQQGNSKESTTPPNEIQEVDKNNVHNDSPLEEHKVEPITEEVMIEEPDILYDGEECIISATTELDVEIAVEELPVIERQSEEFVEEDCATIEASEVTCLSQINAVETPELSIKEPNAQHDLKDTTEEIHNNKPLEELGEVNPDDALEEPYLHVSNYEESLSEEPLKEVLSNESLTSHDIHKADDGIMDNERTSYQPALSSETSDIHTDVIPKTPQMPNKIVIEFPTRPILCHENAQEDLRNSTPVLCSNDWKTIRNPFEEIQEQVLDINKPLEENQKDIPIIREMPDFEKADTGFSLLVDTAVHMQYLPLPNTPTTEATNTAVHMQYSPLPKTPKTRTTTNANKQARSRVRIPSRQARSAKKQAIPVTPSEDRRELLPRAAKRYATYISVNQQIRNFMELEKLDKEHEIKNSEVHSEDSCDRLIIDEDSCLFEEDTQPDNLVLVANKCNYMEQLKKLKNHSSTAVNKSKIKDDQKSKEFMIENVDKRGRSKSVDEIAISNRTQLSRRRKRVSFEEVLEQAENYQMSQKSTIIDNRRKSDFLEGEFKLRRREAVNKDENIKQRQTIVSDAPTQKSPRKKKNSRASTPSIKKHSLRRNNDVSSVNLPKFQFSIEDQKVRNLHHTITYLPGEQVNEGTKKIEGTQDRKNYYQLSDIVNNPPVEDPIIDKTKNILESTCDKLLRYGTEVIPMESKVIADEEPLDLTAKHKKSKPQEGIKHLKIDVHLDENSLYNVSLVHDKCMIEKTENGIEIENYSIDTIAEEPVVLNKLALLTYDQHKTKHPDDVCVNPRERVVEEMISDVKMDSKPEYSVTRFDEDSKDVSSCTSEDHNILDNKTDAISLAKTNELLSSDQELFCPLEDNTSITAKEPVVMLDEGNSEIFTEDMVAGNEEADSGIFQASTCQEELPVEKKELIHSNKFEEVGVDSESAVIEEGLQNIQEDTNVNNKSLGIQEETNIVNSKSLEADMKTPHHQIINGDNVKDIEIHVECLEEMVSVDEVVVEIHCDGTHEESATLEISQEEVVDNIPNSSELVTSEHDTTITMDVTIKTQGDEYERHENLNKISIEEINATQEDKNLNSEQGKRAGPNFVLEETEIGTGADEDVNNAINFEQSSSGLEDDTPNLGCPSNSQGLIIDRTIVVETVDVSREEPEVPEEQGSIIDTNEEIKENCKAETGDHVDVEVPQDMMQLILNDEVKEQEENNTIEHVHSGEGEPTPNIIPSDLQTSSVNNVNMIRAEADGEILWRPYASIDHPPEHGVIKQIVTKVASESIAQTHSSEFPTKRRSEQDNTRRRNKRQKTALKKDTTVAVETAVKISCRKITVAIGEQEDSSVVTDSNVRCDHEITVVSHEQVTDDIYDPTNLINNDTQTTCENNELLTTEASCTGNTNISEEVPIVKNMHGNITDIQEEQVTHEYCPDALLQIETSRKLKENMDIAAIGQVEITDDAVVQQSENMEQSPETSQKHFTLCEEDADQLADIVMKDGCNITYNEEGKVIEEQSSAYILQMETSQENTNIAEYEKGKYCQNIEPASDVNMKDKYPNSDINSEQDRDDAVNEHIKVNGNVEIAFENILIPEHSLLPTCNKKTVYVLEATPVDAESMMDEDLPKACSVAPSDSVIAAIALPIKTSNEIIIDTDFEDTSLIDIFCPDTNKATITIEGSNDFGEISINTRHESVHTDQTIVSQCNNSRATETTVNSLIGSKPDVLKDSERMDEDSEESSEDSTSIDSSVLVLQSDISKSDEANDVHNSLIGSKPDVLEDSEGMDEDSKESSEASTSIGSSVLVSRCDISKTGKATDVENSVIGSKLDVLEDSASMDEDSEESSDSSTSMDTTVAVETAVKFSCRKITVAMGEQEDSSVVIDSNVRCDHEITVVSHEQVTDDIYDPTNLINNDTQTTCENNELLTTEASCTGNTNISEEAPIVKNMHGKITDIQEEQVTHEYCPDALLQIETSHKLKENMDIAAIGQVEITDDAVVQQSENMEQSPETSQKHFTLCEEDADQLADIVMKDGCNITYNEEGKVIEEQSSAYILQMETSQENTNIAEYDKGKYCQNIEPASDVNMKDKYPNSDINSEQDRDDAVNEHIIVNGNVEIAFENILIPEHSLLPTCNKKTVYVLEATPVDAESMMDEDLPKACSVAPSDSVIAAIALPIKTSNEIIIDTDFEDTSLIDIFCPDTNKATITTEGSNDFGEISINTRHESVHTDQTIVSQCDNSRATETTVNSLIGSKPDVLKDSERMDEDSEESSEASTSIDSSILVSQCDISKTGEATDVHNSLIGSKPDVLEDSTSMDEDSEKSSEASTSIDCSVLVLQSDISKSDEENDVHNSLIGSKPDVLEDSEGMDEDSKESSEGSTSIDSSVLVSQCDISKTGKATDVDNSVIGSKPDVLEDSTSIPIFQKNEGKTVESQPNTEDCTVLEDLKLHKAKVTNIMMEETGVQTIDPVDVEEENCPSKDAQEPKPREENSVTHVTIENDDLKNVQGNKELTIDYAMDCHLYHKTKDQSIPDDQQFDVSNLLETGKAVYKHEYTAENVPDELAIQEIKEQSKTVIPSDNNVETSTGYNIFEAKPGKTVTEKECSISSESMDKITDTSTSLIKLKHVSELIDQKYMVTKDANVKSTIDTDSCLVNKSQPDLCDKGVLDVVLEDPTNIMEEHGLLDIDIYSQVEIDSATDYNSEATLPSFLENDMAMRGSLSEPTSFSDDAEVSERLKYHLSVKIADQDSIGGPLIMGSCKNNNSREQQSPEMSPTRKESRMRYTEHVDGISSFPEPRCISSLMEVNLDQNRSVVQSDESVNVFQLSEQDRQYYNSFIGNQTLPIMQNVQCTTDPSAFIDLDLHLELRSDGIMSMMEVDRFMHPHSMANQLSPVDLQSMVAHLKQEVDTDTENNVEIEECNSSLISSQTMDKTIDYNASLPEEIPCSLSASSSMTDEKKYLTDYSLSDLESISFHNNSETQINTETPKPATPADNKRSLTQKVEVKVNEFDYASTDNMFKNIKKPDTSPTKPKPIVKPQKEKRLLDLVEKLSQESRKPKTRSLDEDISLYARKKTRPERTAPIKHPPSNNDSLPKLEPQVLKLDAQVIAPVIKKCETSKKAQVISTSTVRNKSPRQSHRSENSSVNNSVDVVQPKEGQLILNNCKSDTALQYKTASWNDETNVTSIPPLPVLVDNRPKGRRPVAEVALTVRNTNTKLPPSNISSLPQPEPVNPTVRNNNNTRLPPSNISSIPHSEPVIPDTYDIVKRRQRNPPDKYSSESSLAKPYQSDRRRRKTASVKTHQARGKSEQHLQSGNTRQRIGSLGSPDEEYSASRTRGIEGNDPQLFKRRRLDDPKAPRMDKRPRSRSRPFSEERDRTGCVLKMDSKTERQQFSLDSPISSTKSRFTPENHLQKAKASPYTYDKKSKTSSCDRQSPTTTSSSGVHSWKVNVESKQKNSMYNKLSSSQGISNSAKHADRSSKDRDNFNLSSMDKKQGTFSPLSSTSIPTPERRLTAEELFDALTSKKDGNPGERKGPNDQKPWPSNPRPYHSKQPTSSGSRETHHSLHYSKLDAEASRGFDYMHSQNHDIHQMRPNHNQQTSRSYHSNDKGRQSSERFKDERSNNYAHGSRHAPYNVPPQKYVWKHDIDYHLSTYSESLKRRKNIKDNWYEELENKIVLPDEYRNLFKRSEQDGNE